MYINPDSPVNEQAAERIHEFFHPHYHHSRENLLKAEEELDDAGGDAPIIVKELEGMRSRAWRRQPSALWYVLDALASSASAIRHKSCSLVTQHTILTTLFNVGFSI